MDSSAGTKWQVAVNVTASVKRNPSPTSWIATGPPGGVQMPASVGNGRLAICTNYKDVAGKRAGWRIRCRVWSCVGDSVTALRRRCAVRGSGADVSFMLFSDDRGKTWNASTSIPLGDASLNNECQMALGGAGASDSGGYEVRAPTSACDAALSSRHDTRLTPTALAADVRLHSRRAQPTGRLTPLLVQLL